MLYSYRLDNSAGEIVLTQHNGYAIHINPMTNKHQYKKLTEDQARIVMRELRLTN